MPKVKISEYSATANSNTDVASINIDEGCAPSGINNAIRAVMGHLKDFQQGTNGDPFNGPHNGTVGATTPSTGAFTTLSASSTVTLSGGTANGVAYLNGSKVLTTGSALSFNGTSTLTLNASAANLTLGISTNYGLVTATGTNPASIYFNGGSRTGFESHLQYFGANHTFFNETGGSEIMRLLNTGNVGIGTSSPAVGLDVTKAGVRIGATTGYTVASVRDSTPNKGVTLGYDSGSQTGIIIGETNSASSNLAFWTYEAGVSGWAERMRLDSSGNLLVASTASSPPTAGGFSITPEGQGAGTPAILRWNKSASGNYYAAQFMYSGSIVGSIEVSNTATAFVTSSDYRLKENIAPMTGALSVVQQLKPCTYTWKSEGSVGQGFIAHELQAIVPDAVVGEKDAVNEDGSIKPQGIDTSFLVATLTAAIQEQQALIVSMRDELDALKTKVGA